MPPRKAPATFEVFRGAETYSRHVSGVAALFSTVFHRPFPGQTWEQWYLANPYGSPLAVVGYSNGHVVAHHALVPQTLVGSGGNCLRYVLSMSTMVHPEYRGCQTFLYMVDTLHEAAGNAGAAFVLAFPNSSSAPLFEKLCRYKPMVQTELCDWRPSPFAAASREGVDGPWEMQGKPQHSYPPDSVYWNWRTQNNHATSCTVDGTLHLVYKVIEPATLMLLDARVEGERCAAECLANFASGLGLSEVRLTKYHAALLGIRDADLTPHEGYVVRFFGFPLAEEVPDIRFSLLLSDVF